MKRIEYYINVLHYSIYSRIRKLNFLLLGIPDVAAGRILLGFSAIIGGMLFIISDQFLKDSLNDLIMSIFIFVFGVITYYMTLYNDKYLIYFKEFEKKPKEWKRKWAWISFFTVIGIILFFMLSFTLYGTILKK